MAELYNNVTNRRGLLVYGGEASDDYGMVIAEAPAFDKPVRKATAFKVPGRNGTILIQEDAYEDTNRVYKVWLADDAKKNLTETVSALTAWLISQNGYTRLEDSFEPDYYRMAYYNGGNEVSNEFMQYGEASLVFTCKPQRFLKEGEHPITVINGKQIYNPTRFTAKPFIHLEGVGVVTISIGGKVLSANIADYINIDCEAMNAFRLDSENMNNNISGEFPEILPGVNTIGITGAVTACLVTPQYFTI